MCQSKSEGGKRCTYADEITNVRKKALYKHRNAYNRNTLAEKAVNDWKDAHPELVAEHLPETIPLQSKPGHLPIPKTLTDQFTPNARTPVEGAAAGLTKEIYEEGEAWRASLTEDEEWAVRNYTMTAFEDINAVLRRNTRKVRGGDARLRNPEAWAKMEKKIKEERIAPLDAAMKKAEKVAEPRKLYRFYRIPAGMTTGQFLDKYMKEGGAIQDAGYMSTTADPAFLMAHIQDRLGSKPNNHYVVFEILTGQGACVQDKPYTRAGSIQTLEHEYLIPRRTKFRIAGVRKRQKFVYGRDRRDLWAQYGGRGWMGDDRGWERNGNYRADDGTSFPVIQLVDEALIREHSKANTQ